MGMTRRDAIVGLVSLPAALNALAAGAADDSKIMGPTVFHWE